MTYPLHPPSLSSTGTSLLSHQNSKSTAGGGQDKGKRKKGGGERKKPAPIPTNSAPVMGRGGARWDQELGKNFVGVVRVKFQGCSFPVGGYTGKVVFSLPLTDWLPRKLESGKLRAGTGEGRENSPRE